jgi:hypothetical protein
MKKLGYILVGIILAFLGLATYTATYGADRVASAIGDYS